MMNFCERDARLIRIDLVVLKFKPFICVFSSGNRPFPPFPLIVQGIKKISYVNKILPICYCLGGN
jgi:hypothetical protein